MLLIDLSSIRDSQLPQLRRSVHWSISYCWYPETLMQLTFSFSQTACSSLIIIADCLPHPRSLVQPQLEHFPLLETKIDQIHCGESLESDDVRFRCLFALQLGLVYLIVASKTFRSSSLEPPPTIWNSNSSYSMTLHSRSLLINCRRWLGRKVGVGALKRGRVRDDLHRSCVHGDDGECPNEMWLKQLMTRLFLFLSLALPPDRFFVAARKLYLVLRPSWIPRYLFICRQKFVFGSRTCPANALDEWEHRTKGCHTRWQQSRFGAESLCDIRGWVQSIFIS